MANVRCGLALGYCPVIRHNEACDVEAGRTTKRLLQKSKYGYKQNSSCYSY